MNQLFRPLIATLLILSGCGGVDAENIKSKTEHAVDRHNEHTGAMVEPDYASNPTAISSAPVDNFLLLDHRGEAHELYYHSDASAIAIMVQGNGCPIVRKGWSDFAQVRDQFSDKNIEFFMLNANRQDARSAILAEAEEFSFDVPILHDETQLIAESLNVTRTAEVILIDPSDWTIRYRGPVNDRLGYGEQRIEARNNYLTDAIVAVLEGKPVEKATRSARGCLVNFENDNAEGDIEPVTYTETIAPILAANCVMCHQQGGIGPWAMSDYEMVKGFSPMIREVIRTQRMPPWSADPEVGVFHNARTLTPDQKRKIVHWVEAGAPRGEGMDPLKGRKSDAEDWPLGEPDLIIDLPPFTVPANGTIGYQFPTVVNPLTEDKWVRAAMVLPGDSTVVHHALVGSSPNRTPPGEADDGDIFENFLMGYVPGFATFLYPKDSGVEVKAGGEFRFQMHYTPSGKEVIDKTRLALYFYDEKPDYRLYMQVALNVRLNIPAGAPRHKEHAYFEFDNPATIYMLFPHAHYRGRSSKYTVLYPDGREKLILSVPKYDFNWQHSYILDEPLSVPAGARLIHETVYDNSAANFTNPDPTQDVGWGLQSADEMLYGGFFFRWTEETHDNPVHDPLVFETRQAFGFFDSDMNGEMEPNEMVRGLKRAWDNGPLKRADLDKNNALSFDEYLLVRRYTEGG
ncbi:MAG: redoxin domain-containing protein [Pseudomonadota bacterium]